ncbi:MAG: hypothetical protein IJD12_03275 [Tidjanibacter sp.]|nr:hypothetical protein [Tidjanibacter sp.]
MIGTIASVVAAIAAVATLVFTIGTSRWWAMWRTGHINRQIRYIDDYQQMKYGYHKTLLHPAMTKMDMKKAKLLAKRERLSRYL